MHPPNSQSCQNKQAIIQMVKEVTKVLGLDQRYALRPQVMVVHNVRVCVMVVFSLFSL